MSGLPTVLPQSHTCGFCAEWEMYTVTCNRVYATAKPLLDMIKILIVLVELFWPLQQKNYVVATPQLDFMEVCSIH